MTSDEILPNKLPLKRRLSEFRFGRDGGSLSIGKKTGKLRGLEREIDFNIDTLLLLYCNYILNHAHIYLYL